MTLKYPLHFVDIETTSLDAKRGDIIAIAIISESKAGERSSWYSLVKPDSLETADYMSLKIAGYTVERWRDAPSFDSVAPLVYEFLTMLNLMCHSSKPR
jgi:DNA polymerase III epsilon subunit-like protein